MAIPGDRTHRIVHVRQFCSRLPAVLTPRPAAIRVHKSSSNSGPQLCRTTPADLLVRGIAYLGRIQIQRIQATRGVPCFAAECCGDTLASTSCRASQQTLRHCVQVNLRSISITINRFGKQRFAEESVEERKSSVDSFECGDIRSVMAVNGTARKRKKRRSTEQTACSTGAQSIFDI